MKDRSVHILAEPVGRNTAACVGLGALYARHLGCNEAVAFLPADHFIGNPAAFLDSLQTAAEIAESGGIVTLGIVPHRPETGYGYIKRDASGKASAAGKAYRVKRFVEKPDAAKAREYLFSGDFYWNAGVFVATPSTILEQVETNLPALYGGLERLKRCIGTEGFANELKAVYENLESISFDYGVMEKTQSDVYVVPCECGWSDVGSWTSVYELNGSKCDAKQNLSQGEAIIVDCERSFVSGRGGRLVACLGLKNCLVVDTPDALLVADLENSQEIRRVVEELNQQGKEKLL
jgi:mannose-1-phosphate guanylyltransferase